MFDLIVRQINRTRPDLIGLQSHPAKAMRDIHIPATLKRDLLKYVWQEAGSAFLLSIGQGVREAQYDPIWRGACQSKSPEFLFEKWRRFEKFSHSTNRLHIEKIDQNKAYFRRYTIDGDTPTTPENFLICGLMIALLEEIGCIDLRCEMSSGEGSTYTIRKNQIFQMPPEIDQLSAVQWQIEWREFAPQPREPNSDVVSLPVSDNFINDVNSLIQILVTDVSHHWSVEELAREAGYSKRSLQRKLKEAGYSFSTLIRIVRIHKACCLLAVSQAPLTSIAFGTGFSDSAHFSRDFRTSMGMTPTDYRDGLLGR